MRGFPKDSRIFRRNESEVAQSVTSPGDEGRGECLFDEASGGGDIGMGFNFSRQHNMSRLSTRIKNRCGSSRGGNARAGRLEQSLHNKLNWRS